MSSTSKPEDDPLEPGATVNADDAAEERGHSELPIQAEEEDADELEDETEGLGEVDIETIESIVEKNDDTSLVASKIIPAERGYTIEELQKGDPVAWDRAGARLLKIAVYKYRDVVHYYLPGVDEEDAKSAAGEIIPDLCKNISEYSSVPQFEAAFRTALRRDVYSLLRKYLAQKRGVGKTIVTAELNGLDQTDKSIDQRTYEEEAEAPPKLESTINPEYGDWGATQTANASASAARQIQKKLLSEAMDALDPVEKQMIQWSAIGGLKQREIAQRLGKNPKQIGSELNRVKEKLRKAVSEKLLIERKNLL